jgi:type IV pilus assembly protein PilF
MTDSSVLRPSPSAPTVRLHSPGDEAGRIPSVMARLTGAVVGMLLLAAVAACANGPVSPGPDRSGEPITESDEPEARKRARLRIELASGYFDQGQTSVALDQIKQALQADPNYGPAYYLRGLVYMRLNDAALAEESFRRSLQINPKDPDALHNFGVFVCQQGRHVEAVQLFSRALASPLYVGQAKTLMMQGTCQLRMGQTTEAESSFARSYELDPSNPYVGYNLASLEFRRGELTKAQFVVRRINNSEQANAESLWLGIKVERAMNNQQAAEQLAQQLQRRFPRSKELSAYQRGAFNE